MNPKEKMEMAQIRVLLEEPFFASLLMQLQFREDKSLQTACTNGVELIWNPDFIETLTLSQTAGLLVHEVEHCALLHPFRFKGMDMRRANIATDYEINNMLDNYTKEIKHHKCFELPEGALINHAWDKNSAEEIYGLLPDRKPDGNSQKPNGKGSPSDSGEVGSQPSWGEFSEAPSQSEAETKEQEVKWKVAIVQAAHIAAKAGKLPSSMKRLVDELLHPKVDWREALRQFVSSHAKNDYAWNRPNRRHLGSGFILPSLHSQTLGKIAVCIDTSGSINDKQLGEFLAEIKSIVFQTRPEATVLIECDCKVNQVLEFGPDDEIKCENKGGGGTDLTKVFDKLEELNETPTCLILLTDLQTPFPKEEPNYPVLWAATTNLTAPIGRTIHLNG